MYQTCVSYFKRAMHDWTAINIKHYYMALQESGNTFYRETSEHSIYNLYGDLRFRHKIRRIFWTNKFEILKWLLWWRWFHKIDQIVCFLCCLEKPLFSFLDQKCSLGWTRQSRILWNFPYTNFCGNHKAENHQWIIGLASLIIILLYAHTYKIIYVQVNKNMQNNSVHIWNFVLKFY